MLVKLIKQINVAHVVVTIKNDILPFIKCFTPKIALNHNYFYAGFYTAEQFLLVLAGIMCNHPHIFIFEMVNSNTNFINFTNNIE